MNEESSTRAHVTVRSGHRHGNDRGPPWTLRCRPRLGLAPHGARIEKLRRAAYTLIQADATMCLRLELLIGISVIGQISALQLLGELMALPPEMNVRPWVAHSGLDPAHLTSGTSVHQTSRISRARNRHLRRALYMSALAAVRRSTPESILQSSNDTKPKCKHW